MFENHSKFSQNLQCNTGSAINITSKAVSLGQHSHQDKNTLYRSCLRLNNVGHRLFSTDASTYKTGFSSWLHSSHSNNVAQYVVINYNKYQSFLFTFLFKYK